MQLRLPVTFFCAPWAVSHRSQLRRRTISRHCRLHTVWHAACIWLSTFLRSSVI